MIEENNLKIKRSKLHKLEIKELGANGRFLFSSKSGSSSRKFFGLEKYLDREDEIIDTKKFIIIPVIIVYGNKSITVNTMINSGLSLRHIKPSLIEYNVQETNFIRRYKSFDSQDKSLKYIGIINKLLVKDVNNKTHELRFDRLYSKREDNFDLLIGTNILKHYYSYGINRESISLTINEKTITIDKIIDKAKHLLQKMETNYVNMNITNKMIEFIKIKKV